MQKIFKSVMAVVLAAVLCFFAVSCSSRNQKYTDTYFDVFDSFASVTVYCGSEKDYERFNGIFRDEIYRWHELLDIYNEYDGKVNLCTLNRTAGEKPVGVSRELFVFLEKAVELCGYTDGYTSVTIGALTSVWKNAIAEQTVPSEDDLELASEHTNASALILDSDSGTVFFQDGLLKLDAGAFAKGYVAEYIYNLLVNAGCESFLLNLGGTLCAFGQKNGGADWYGGIQSPSGEGSLADTVNISEKAMSTSGSYLRGFDLNGVRYHHIINPYTKAPENRFLSVTVVCKSATMADVMSTALFSMSYDEGKNLSESLELETVWIYADGTVTSTDGLNISE